MENYDYNEQPKKKRTGRKVFGILSFLIVLAAAG